MTISRILNKNEITSLLFPENQDSGLPSCPEYGQDMSFQLGDGVLLHCRYYSRAEEAPVIFYLPDPGSPLSGFDKCACRFLDQGMNLFLATYRGCGPNDGTPSVTAMYEDTEQLFALALEKIRALEQKGAIFLMGQSLGSICAIDIVYKQDELVKGLIVESGIFSTSGYLEALGASFGPEEIEEACGFNNLEKIEKIKNPTLIFHGARDRLVTIAQAEELQASSGARTKQFFIIPGAERDSVSQTGGPQYLKTIKQFTDTVCGVNTWRQRRKKHKKNLEDKR